VCRLSIGIDLDRFSHFKDAEFRSIDILSPTHIKLLFATQDSARDFDWITVELEFNGVNDARLLQKHQLSLVDLSDGISIIKKDGLFAFGVSECYNLSTIKNSNCFIISTGFKYQEGSF